MTETRFVKCPGCLAVVDTQYSICAGCGRCIFCGNRRCKKVSHCPECDVPYCECCGRCAGCGGVRYSDLPEPCTCGIADDPVRRQEFIQSERVLRSGERPWWKFW
ncbi:hypothetical protein [Aeoliella sp.]|uniref:hypothetical protein n=1 Tax=Aeoliella sp. TaxID=2795800 RepID=UPI003CCC1ACA